MHYWALGIRYIAMTLGCLVVLARCMLQGTHYKSLTEIRRETASNYSQQVLETIVEVCDEAKLPTLFSVGTGGSLWTPSYTGGVQAMIPTPKPSQTGLTVSLGAAESLTQNLQYNDFGAAALSRVTTLYYLLCFELRYGNVVLPNGTFYTAVERANSHESFLLWTQRPNGQYIGVTEQKREQFVRFAHDITYWTQHAEPALHDLLSTTGKLYRFSVESTMAIANLRQARAARSKMEQAVAAVQAELKAKQQAFDALKAQATTSKADPRVVQTLLQLAGQELQGYMQAVPKVTAELDKLDSDIRSNMRILEELERVLGSALAELKDNDADLASLDIASIIAAFHSSIDTMLREDGQPPAAFGFTAPQVAGSHAQDSASKVYGPRSGALQQLFVVPH